MKYEIPAISLEHIRRLTTDFGIIHSADISVPDLNSGYTLDDNARAMIAMVRHYQTSSDPKDLELIGIYLDFIMFCQQPDGTFLNYVDRNRQFFDKNGQENLEDSNGRAIWALGELISHNLLLPPDMLEKAGQAIQSSMLKVVKMRSPRAIAFSIKGLYYYDQVRQHNVLKQTIITLADNLVSKYRGVSGPEWKWYEDYLTYANSVLPEAMLLAFLSTGHKLYGEIARQSFDFLMSVIFRNGQIKVVSNQGWHMKTGTAHEFGEQPIDVSYTIMALGRFYDVYKEDNYLDKMEVAFNWFLGKNHLQCIIYNPCTGGCYDGLEQHHVNLNQGAESTVSYLMARLSYEKYFNAQREIPVNITKTLYHS